MPKPKPKAASKRAQRRPGSARSLKVDYARMATGKGGKGKPEGAIAKKESKAKTKAKAKPRTQDGSPIRDYLEGPGGSHAQSYRRGRDHRVRIPARRTLACNRYNLGNFVVIPSKRSQ